MPPIKILTEAERDAFEAPPRFTSVERKHHFHIPKNLEATLSQLRTDTNRVRFILKLGYFRATGKFFAGKFHGVDVEYVASQLGFLPGMVDLSTYDEKATSSRHRQLILEYLGVREFGTEAQQELVQEIRNMVRAQDRPKFILHRVVDLLKARKIEVPTAYTLTALIGQEIKRHRGELIAAVDRQLSPEQRALLDALLDKPGQAEGVALPWQRYTLTLLKRFSQSTRPSKIKANVDDLRVLRDLYQQLETVVESLDLTQEGMRYYAHSVLKSQVFQIARRSDEDRYLHLICFVAHQFFRLQDTLVDALLTCVQNTLNTCKRQHKEIYYEQRIEHRRSVKTLVEAVQQGACDPLDQIQHLAFCEDLPDDEKVHRIQAVLTHGQPQRETVAHQVAAFREYTAPSAGDAEYYRLLESRSLKLQNRVSQILKEVDFEGDGRADLQQALRNFKDRDGALTPAAPTDFLEPHQQPLVYTESGQLRVSLYKALLFIKVAEAVKAGALNVRASYKYRSLDDYLIPKDAWLAHRSEYLHRADLVPSELCSATLNRLAATLHAQFSATNRHILDGDNPHIHFRKDGSFHVSTPKTDAEDQEPLTGYFPENRYISLLEVFATVHRLSGFVDDFQHWQVRGNRPRPPQRTFFAGIIGYGCFIGTRKIARISKQINEAELDYAVNWYFSLENIQAANNRILALMDQLELPEVYRREPGVLHTSSDGQKFEVAVDSLNANYSYKYFGQNQGVSAYNFIDERHFLPHSDVISSAEREAAYVIDGLMHNDVVKSDIHSTDTHGYSEVIFAVMHLLGFSFAPRIKNLKVKRLYAFPDHRRKEYQQQGFKVLPDGYINPSIIEAHWDDILRFVATIKLKYTTASQLFKRLNSYSTQHPLWGALKEFGKIPKSDFILRYIDILDLRQAIEKQLGKSESSNKFSRAVSFGNNQEFLHGEKVEQQIAEGCRRLIKNAIICWNYLYLTQKIAQEHDPQKKQGLIDAVRAGSIVTWRHINLHGEYDFSDEKLRDSIGLAIPTKPILPATVNGNGKLT
jgi:TnpA family transposase